MKNVFPYLDETHTIHYGLKTRLLSRLRRFLAKLELKVQHLAVGSSIKDWEYVKKNDPMYGVTPIKSGQHSLSIE